MKILQDTIVALILSICYNHANCNSVLLKLTDGKNASNLKEVASSKHASYYSTRDNKNEEIIVPNSFPIIQIYILKLYHARIYEKHAAFLENSYLKITPSNNYENGGSNIISVSQIGAAYLNAFYYRARNRLNKIQLVGSNNCN